MSSEADKWKTLASEELFKTEIFRLRRDRCELPDGREMPGYYVMEFPHWVNVVPVTPEGKLVLIEQYRHAAGENMIEVPGGSVDATDADPKRAGLRELVEETGYVPEDIRFVGRHSPNPAMQTNHMYTYVALGCRKTREQNLDTFEDIKVVTKSKH